MEKRSPALVAVTVIALLIAKPSFAGVVLDDWMAPPRLGLSTSHPGPYEPVPPMEPVKSVPATTDVGNSPSQDNVVLPPDGPNAPQIAPVPEPSTWLLLILGFAGV